MDTVIACGLPAPDFTLPDLEGRLHTLSAYGGQIVIINFWSAECPQTARADQELLSCLPTWGRRLVLLSIAANANEPPELLRKTAAERGVPVVLHDDRHQVADRYGAVTTPHFYVIDPAGTLRYQGALDDVTFHRRLPSQRYLRQAVEALLAGSLPDPEQTPPYGCAIVRYL